MFTAFEVIILIIIVFVVNFLVTGLVVAMALNSIKKNLPNIIKMFGQQIMRLLKSAKANAVKSQKNGGGGGGFTDIIGSVIGGFVQSPQGQQMIGNMLSGGMQKPKV